MYLKLHGQRLCCYCCVYVCEYICVCVSICLCVYISVCVYVCVFVAWDTQIAEDMTLLCWVTFSQRESPYFDSWCHDPLSPPSIPLPQRPYIYLPPSSLAGIPHCSLASTFGPLLTTQHCSQNDPFTVQINHITPPLKTLSLASYLNQILTRAHKHLMQGSPCLHEHLSPTLSFSLCFSQ